MEVFLKSCYVRNENDLSDFEFLVYTGLRMIYREDIENQYVSLNQIIVTLFGGMNISRRIRSELKAALLSLVDLSNGHNSEYALARPVAYIDGKFNEFIMDLSALWFDTKENRFTVITDEEIRKILNMDFNGHIESVFRYYCVLLSTINHTDNINVGNLALKEIRSYIDSVRTEMTQLSYNRLLEKCGVLYIHHNDYLVRDISSVKALPNFYGRYSDKDKVDATAKQKYNSIKRPIDRSSVESNEIRSLKQKMNAMSRGTKYSKQELHSMRLLAERENKRIYDMMANTDDEMMRYSLSKRIINMSVFN